MRTEPFLRPSVRLVPLALFALPAAAASQGTLVGSALDQPGRLVLPHTAPTEHGLYSLAPGATSILDELLDPDGVTTAFGIDRDRDGRIVVADRTGNPAGLPQPDTGFLYRLDVAGGYVEDWVQPPELVDPEAVEVDPISGDTFVADPGASAVFRIDAETGAVTIVAGSDQGIALPADLEMLPNGQLLVADVAARPPGQTGGSILRVDPETGNTIYLATGFPKIESIAHLPNTLTVLAVDGSMTGPDLYSVPLAGGVPTPITDFPSFEPTAVRATGAGRVFVAGDDTSTGDGVVKEIDPATGMILGSASSLGSSLPNLRAMCVTGLPFVATGKNPEEHPTADFDPTNRRWLVAWKSGSEIRARLLDESGRPWSNEIVIRTQAGVAYSNPSVAFRMHGDPTQQGSFLIAYRGLGGGTFLECREVAADGTPGSIQSLDLGGNYTYTGPEVAARHGANPADTGAWGVAWSRSASSLSSTLWFQRVSTFPGVQSVAMATGTGALEPRDASLARYEGSGGSAWLAVYSTGDGLFEMSDVRGVWVDDSGGAPAVLGSSFVLDATPSSDQRTPTVAVNPLTDRLMIAWEDDRRDVSEVFGIGYSVPAIGTPPTGVTGVVDLDEGVPPDPMESFDPVLATRELGFAVAYRNVPTPGAIPRIDAMVLDQAWIRGDQFRAAAAPTANGGSSPDAAVDPLTGSVLTVYEQASSSGPDTSDVHGYLSDRHPRLSVLLPLGGPAGGFKTTLFGDLFQVGPFTQVLVEGQAPLQVAVQDTQTIDIQLPAHDRGLLDVTVSTPEGERTYEDALAATPALRVDGVPETGGTVSFTSYGSTPNAFALLYTSTAILPTPIDLGALGDLWLDPDQGFLVLGQDGVSLACPRPSPIYIPENDAFPGIEMHFQSFVFDVIDGTIEGLTNVETLDILP